MNKNNKVFNNNLIKILSVMTLIYVLGWSVSGLATDSIKTSSNNFSVIGIVSDISENNLKINQARGSDSSGRTDYDLNIENIENIQTNTYIPIDIRDIKVGDRVIAQGLSNGSNIFIKRLISFSTDIKIVQSDDISTTTATTTDDVQDQDVLLTSSSTTASSTDEDSTASSTSASSTNLSDTISNIDDVVIATTTDISEEDSDIILDSDGELISSSTDVDDLSSSTEENIDQNSTSTESVIEDIVESINNVVDSLTKTISDVVQNVTDTLINVISTSTEPTIIDPVEEPITENPSESDESQPSTSPDEITIN